MKSFTMWQVATEGLKELFGDLPQDAQVWRGEDGSYLVGDASEFGPEHEDTEYSEAGKVFEYLMEEEWVLQEQIGDIQSLLARYGVDYANHTIDGAIGVLGTGDMMASLGELSDEEIRAFVIVGKVLLKNQADPNEQHD